jgi:spermidine/putrescine transport system substrate-binding protein
MTGRKNQLTRRDLLKTGTAVAAGALFTGRLSSKAQAAASEIVWGTNEAYARPKFLEPFEKESGTPVKTELFSDPAEVVTKLKAGGAGVHMLVDGCYHIEISYAEGVLQPIDMANVPNWAHVVDEFKDAAGLSFDGKQYGIPIVWGTNSMVYRYEDVGQELTDIGALFDKQFEGRISMPNGLFESLIVGAMYLGINKPFEMTKDELNAVVDLLIKQKPMVRTYWNDIGDLKNLMATGEIAVGWGWQPVMELRGTGVDVRWAHPKQGELAWYDANYLTKEADGDVKAACEAFTNYLAGDTYGRLLGDETGYRTASKLAIEKMPPDLQTKLDITKPSLFLKSATWFLSPKDPAAYQAAWDRVLNA